MDLVLLQYFHDFMVLIIEDPADLGVGEGAVDAKVLQSARRDAQQFPDLIGFEPFFVRLLVLVFQ